MAAVKKGKVRDTDKGFKALSVRIAGMAKPVPLKVGILADTGAQAHGDDAVTILQVALANEFGTDNIPARPFIRGYVDANEQRVKAMISKVEQEIAKGSMTREQGLNLLGQRLVAEIQDRMSKGIPPPNAPSTIERKGSSTPLIDTGQLRSSIKYTIGGRKET